MVKIGVSFKQWNIPYRNQEELPLHLIDTNLHFISSVNCEKIVVEDLSCGFGWQIDGLDDVACVGSCELTPGGVNVNLELCTVLKI